VTPVCAVVRRTSIGQLQRNVDGDECCAAKADGDLGRHGQADVRAATVPGSAS
jgi:hypothetical protein